MSRPRKSSHSDLQSRQRGETVLSSTSSHSDKKVSRMGLTVLSGLLLVVVLFAITFSHHGLLDLWKLRSQMRATESHITEVQEKNRVLSRKLRLLEEGYLEGLEYELRTRFDLKHPEERVYYDPDF